MRKARYSKAARETFMAHMEEQLNQVISELSETEEFKSESKENVQKELEDIFLHIYANPLH